jgi:hypothetical protein
MELIGNIKVINQEQRISDKFTKRDFVVTIDSKTQWPQHIPMQVTQDKCGSLDKFKEGDEVKVQFNLKGREWNGPKGIQYFLTLECWRIELAHLDANHAHAAAAPSFESGNPDDNSDLPF